MSLKTILRSAAIGGATLAATLGLSSCSRDYTVAYVYTISSSTGSINAYGVDYETGILTQITGSPFTTPFTNPVKIISAPNNKFVYVIGGSQNAQVEEFAVGTDGKLYGEHTYDLTGTSPTVTSPTLPSGLNVNAAIDTTGTFLYVTFTYQMGYSTASPGPGGLSIFPINADNSLGTPSTMNLGNNPVGVAVSTPVCVTTPLISGNPTCSTGSGGASGVENTYVYVIDQELATGKPTILGFAQNMQNGSLTALAGTNLNTFQGYKVGVMPSAIAVDGTTRFVYVTDQSQNEVFGFQIARTTTGDLTPLNGSPWGTGQFPVSLTIDPSARYLYTANFSSGSISQFTINQSSGDLAAVNGSAFTAAAGTTCVTIDPALGQFLYTSNYTDGSVSGGELNTATGAVTNVADTPFPSSALPSCITSVANGAHASESLTP